MLIIVVQFKLRLLFNCYIITRIIEISVYENYRVEYFFHYHIVDLKSLNSVCIYTH